MHVGLDIGDILGFKPAASDIALEAAASFDTSNIAKLALLQPFGAIESFEFAQTNSIYERYALGPNSIQAFQTVPQRISNIIKAQRVVLRKMSGASQSIQFFPNNLAHQQLPFLMQLIDPGDGIDPNTQIIHIFFGCWFEGQNVKYEILQKDDVKLIQHVTIKASRVLTLDASIAGNPALQAASGFIGGILATPQAQTLVDDLSLS